MIVLGFASFANANDILAKVSNGMVSDTSAGVKVLSLEEEKQVVGGAFYHRISKLDDGVSQYWLASDGMYITTNSHTGALMSNYQTDSVRKKMGYSGNGIVVLGAKNIKTGAYNFVLYDTRRQLPIGIIDPATYNYYTKSELSTFKSNARW
ncbi:hypothetical protein [Campylobacter sp. MIT 12-5580]|uniref:hypothetical protein n=1 Tax=Campylobacter sp. MIT 12-5580 TaxID=2040651 RepID=UPI001BB0FCD1|nr:hypothetical protein [Campylobacter sp. MIT 12-5580]